MFGPKDRVMAPIHQPGDVKARPFLKWAGGKSQLLKQYSPYFPELERTGRYFEPFLGSAAVFFYLRPDIACLADVNRNLVEIYQVVQEEVEELIQLLQRHRNGEEEFYRIRSMQTSTMSRVERAARLIYLNKTCYNGLYRENKLGEFNVPFGRYRNPTICDPSRLRTASEALQGVQFMIDDFEQVVARACEGDFAYLDPPYAPISPTSSFTSYDRRGFTAKDQKRLAATFDRLTSIGCRVMLSNSASADVYALYGGRGYRLIEIQARRSINSRGDKRGPVAELLILNY